LLNTTRRCDVAETEAEADGQWRSLWHSQPARREVLEHMANKVKGMVQLAGVTYRIVRVAQGSYSVVRISDDMAVGRFKLAPALGIEAQGVEPALLREVARLAIHTAKTSYLGFARPDLAGLEVASANAARRSPSSMPPAVPPAS
jgi:hypothetical protein